MNRVSEGSPSIMINMTNKLAFPPNCIPVLAVIGGIACATILATPSAEASRLGQAEWWITASMDQAFVSRRLSREFDEEIARTAASIGYQLDGESGPRTFPSIEVLGAIPCWRTLFVESGLRFSRRGYRLAVVGNFSHSEVQYDSQLRVTEFVEVVMVSVPITASWRTTDRLNLRAGLVVGFPVRSSSRGKRSFEEHVVANGEVRADLSTPRVETEEDLSGETRAFAPGFVASIRWRLAPRFSLEGGFGFMSRHLDLDQYRDTSGFTASVGMGYRLGGGAF